MYGSVVSVEPVQGIVVIIEFGRCPQTRYQILGVILKHVETGMLGVCQCLYADTVLVVRIETSVIVDIQETACHKAEIRVIRHGRNRID